MIAFLFASVGMTLVAVTLVVLPLLRNPSGRAPFAGVAAALAIPAAVTLIYAGVSSYPWSAGTGAMTRAAGSESADIVALKERLAREPDDGPGWVTLGDAYLAEERFAEARDAYRQAIDRNPGTDDSVRLSFAEAAILVDRSALSGDAGQIIEDVLSRDPANAKALWYGGIAALGRGDRAAARSRWSKLLELSPPPQVRQIIEQQLAQLDGSGAAGSPAPASEVTTRIAVRISVKPELAPRIQRGASLFLFARAPGGTGPPLAVVRRNPADLPLELEISDADSMVPGRSMSGLPEVQLTARMANDGEALPAPGDVFGVATWDSATDGPLQILLDQVVQ